MEVWYLCYVVQTNLMNYRGKNCDKCRQRQMEITFGCITNDNKWTKIAESVEK